MSNTKEITAASLNDLIWMCGPWQGALGPQRVSENWSEPECGTMSTMVRLLEGEATAMVELIVISEQQVQTKPGLTLHLRQFSPELALHQAQTMTLAEIGEKQVAFACVTNEAGDPASIPRLEYRAVAGSDQAMEVHVSVAQPNQPTPFVVTATLSRP